MFSRAAPRTTHTRREYEYAEDHHTHRQGEYHHKHHGLFGRHHRSNPNRRAGGYKAALSNPNTTHDGRKHAKHELKRMGRGNEAHVPLTTRIKHLFGIRSHPNRRRHDRHHY